MLTYILIFDYGFWELFGIQKGTLKTTKFMQQPSKLLQKESIISVVLLECWDYNKIKALENIVVSINFGNNHQNFHKNVFSGFFYFFLGWIWRCLGYLKREKSLLNKFVWTWCGCVNAVFLSIFFSYYGCYVRVCQYAKCMTIVP